MLFQRFRIFLTKIHSCLHVYVNTQFYTIYMRIHCRHICWCIFTFCLPRAQGISDRRRRPRILISIQPKPLWNIQERASLSIFVSIIWVECSLGVCNFRSYQPFLAMTKQYKFAVVWVRFRECFLGGKVQRASNRHSHPGVSW